MLCPPPASIVEAHREIQTLKRVFTRGSYNELLDAGIDMAMLEGGDADADS